MPKDSKAVPPEIHGIHMSRNFNKQIKLRFMSLPVLLIICCTPASKRVSQKGGVFRKVMLSWTVPFLSDEHRLGFMKDSFSIIYHNKTAVYCYYSMHEVLDTKINDANNQIESRVVRTEPVIQYFIVKKDSTHGYYYSSADDPVPDKLPADSVIHTRFAVDEQMLIKESDSLVFKAMQDGKPKKEVYARRKKTDVRDWDSTFLQYSQNLDWVPYRLSPKLDKLKGTSLAGITIITNPDQKAKDPLFRNRVEISFELKEVAFSENDPEAAFIKKLFEKYSSD